LENKLNTLKPGDKFSKNKFKVEIHVDKLFSNKRNHKTLTDFKSHSLTSKSSARSFNSIKNYKSKLVSGVCTPLSVFLNETKGNAQKKPSTARAKKSKISSLREIIGKTKKRSARMKKKKL